MAQLRYTAITSLDGYISDADGNFDWAFPDDEVHRFINARERSVGTYLLGRRMYETLAVWETMDTPDEVSQDFAATWRAADKIVYSTTLDTASTARTRIERRFELAALDRLKASAERDLSIGGPTFAATAFRAGLVDALELYVTPVVVGGGTRALPDDLQLQLDLVEERRFGNGMVYLGYRART
jgi:dihydrofolate reductase